MNCHRLPHLVISLILIGAFFGACGAPTSPTPTEGVRDWNLEVTAAFWQEETGTLRAEPGYKILTVVMNLEYIGPEADIQVPEFGVVDNQGRGFTTVSSIGYGDVVPEGGIDWVSSHIAGTPQTRHFVPGEAFRPIMLTFVGPEDAQGMTFHFGDLPPVDLTSLIEGK